MANVDRANGFRAVKSINGSPVNFNLRRYTAGDRSADTTNNHGDIYIGDPVTLTTGGVLTPADSGDDVLGVAAGVGPTSNVEHGETGPYDPDNLTKRYLAYDEDGYVWVHLADDTLFEVQTAADLDLSPGELADLSTDATEAHGDRSTGFSTAELVTAANNDVIVVEDVDSPDNDTSLVNARHIVRFINTTFAQS